MSMDDILKIMIKKIEVECEDEQRKWISARNGLAGLYSIQKQHEKVVQVYVTSCDLIMLHWKEIRTDALQRLHILQNLYNTLCLYYDLSEHDDVDDVQERETCTDMEELTESHIPNLNAINTLLLTDTFATLPLVKEAASSVRRGKYPKES